MRVHSGFEGGNVERVTIVAADHVRLAARAGGSPRPLWFYCCLEGATVPAVRCDVINADQCYGPQAGWHTARPVISGDGETWHRVARAEYVSDSAGMGYFRCLVPVVGTRTYLAYCYPYGTAELHRLLRQLAEHPAIRTGLVGRSVENRALPWVALGAPREGRRTAWVVARQHAGETPASFAVEGFIRHFLSPERQVQDDLQQCALCVLPMLDVDGVARGRYGKGEPPVDFNRDWRERPARPEVAAALRTFRETGAPAPALVLDLHASHHGESASYLFTWDEGEQSEAAAERHFGALMQEEAGALGFREPDLRSRAPASGSLRGFARRRLGCPALTLELSYHLGQHGGYLTPEDYRAWGAALARAACRYLREPA